MPGMNPMMPGFNVWCLSFPSCNLHWMTLILRNPYWIQNQSVIPTDCLSVSRWWIQWCLEWRPWACTCLGSADLFVKTYCDHYRHRIFLCLRIWIHEKILNLTEQTEKYVFHFAPKINYLLWHGATTGKSRWNTLVILLFWNLKSQRMMPGMMPPHMQGMPGMMPSPAQQDLCWMRNALQFHGHKSIRLKSPFVYVICQKKSVLFVWFAMSCWESLFFVKNDQFSFLEL